ncbi:hypothetical protein JP75_20845 [Devosia riboflavina]|uniref:VOC domain-containing protein n=1 Tax=Devosia riboflavina TaxID=46914 RepID=A0A087LY15_9HYPH|nr:VOC family protein [Devosia riboflavina]KFL29518.1 hypothetical protein JP75_20845 [Devosia riboflavina]
MHIEHLAFNLGDPIAAADWYCAHLGMHAVSMRRQSPVGAFIADDNDMRLELYSKPADPMPLADLSADTFHLAFTTDDIEADIARLVAAGAATLGPVETTPRGDRLSFMRDPFGLCLQLAQRVGDRRS